MYIFLEFFGQYFPKECKFLPKIFRIFDFKSLKLQRFFDIWKWTKDEDEDGSSDKNLQRSKIFEASLQLWYLHMHTVHLTESYIVKSSAYADHAPFLLWLYRTIHVEYRQLLLRHNRKGVWSANTDNFTMYDSVKCIVHLDCLQETVLHS